MHGQQNIKNHATVLRLSPVPTFDESKEISAAWEFGEFFGNIRARERYSISLPY
jgi:hypothetical protein